MPQIAKPILISTDIDDCLIPWENRRRNGPFNELALQRAVGVTNQAADSITLHWNTGRNLASLKNLVEPTAKTRPILDGMKLNFLSTNNGQELYVNAQHAKTGDWIQGLAEADADPRWTQDIEQRTGWSLPKVVLARADVLEAQGFKEVKGDEAQRLMLPTYKNLRVYLKPVKDGLFTVQCFDTQPGYRVSEWRNGQGHLNTEAAEQAGLALQVALQKALNELYGTETTLSHKPMEAGTARFLAFTLFPLGVNKGAVLNLLLSAYMPQAEAVVTVGDDDYNDLDLLRPDTFITGSRKLPNYPVVVGENRRAQQAVADNPRHELVELEHWDAGVARQLQKISALCPSPNQKA